MDAIRELCQPNLNGPVAVIGFKGWGNAGEVSSGVISFLRQALDAQPFAELDIDPFMDFTAERPRVVIRDGRLERISRTKDIFLYDKNLNGRDALLFIGHEPNLRWNGYIEQLTAFLTAKQVGLTILVGGTYDEILHSDPPMVSFMAEEMVLREAALNAGATATDYEGQTAIHTQLYTACREKGLPVLALWGRAPVYVQNGNFGQVRLLAEIIAALGGPNPNSDSLKVAEAEMCAQIEAMIEQSPKLAAYVNRLANRTPAQPAPVIPAETGKVIPLARRTRRTED